MQHDDPRVRLHHRLGGRDHVPLTRAEPDRGDLDGVADHDQHDGQAQEQEGRLDSQGVGDEAGEHGVHQAEQPVVNAEEQRQHGRAPCRAPPVDRHRGFAFTLPVTAGGEDPDHVPGADHGVLDPEQDEHVARGPTEGQHSEHRDRVQADGQSDRQHPGPSLPLAPGLPLAPSLFSRVAAEAGLSQSGSPSSARGGRRGRDRVGGRAVRSSPERGSRAPEVPATRSG